MKIANNERQQRAYSNKKRTVFCLISFAVCLVILSALCCGYIVYRTRSLYENIKTSQRGWSGKVHKADAELGFTPIPDSQGAHIFPIGPEIPMRYDKDGFRTPVSAHSAASTRYSPRPLVLTLGCSFTYGDANYAEDTYPYLIGQYLGGTTKNAGVCSYGLSQMLILARRLVPLYKPDYLIVQYSPWLTQRAQNPFAPTYFGKLPVPYFYGESEIALYPPVFKTKIFDLPNERYRKSPKNMADFASFLWNLGLPMYLHDDFNMVLYHSRRILGLTPKPTVNGKQIEQFVYEEIKKIAKDTETKVLVVVIGNTPDPVRFDENIFPDDFIVVDAQAALLDRLPVVNAETYNRQYAHWRGVPPRIVDGHPNSNAHRIIAEEIILKMKSLP